MKNLKRWELPNYKELPYRFNIEKILTVINAHSEGFNSLSDPYGYGKLVEKQPYLARQFGLKRPSAVANNKLKSSVKGLCEKFVQGEEQSSSYKQLHLTEYNPEFKPEKLDKTLPLHRLDERKYSKPTDWIKGTYLEEVFERFKGKVTRVRCARLEAGSVIKEHIDYCTSYSIRVHIPLITNDSCGFYFVRPKHPKDFLKMPADGRCWFINQGFRHSAWNKGKAHRDHLILSIIGQEDLF